METNGSQKQSAQKQHRANSASQSTTNKQRISNETAQTQPITRIMESFEYCKQKLAFERHATHKRTQTTLREKLGGSKLWEKHTTHRSAAAPTHFRSSSLLKPDCLSLSFLRFCFLLFFSSFSSLPFRSFSSLSPSPSLSSSLSEPSSVSLSPSLSVPAARV